MSLGQFRSLRHFSSRPIAASVLAFFMFTSFSGSSLGDDWPRFRGASGDGAIADFEPPTKWPTELKSLWRVEVGLGYASPVVVGDRVFVLTNSDKQEIVRCLSLATGVEVWAKRYAADPTLSSVVGQYGNCPRATPAVADGRLFTLGAGGRLSAFDAAGGDVLWQETFEDKFPTQHPEFGAASSPLVIDNTCIALVGGKDSGALGAFNVKTGDIRWQLKCEGPSYASPMLLKLGGESQIVVQTQSNMIGVSLTGTKLWSIPFESQYQQNIVTAVAHGDLVIFSGYKQPLQAWRIAGGEPTRVWENPAHSIYMWSPLLKGTRLFGMSSLKAGHVFCVDAQSGSTVWTSPGRSGEYVSVQIADQLLVLLNNKGRLAFADANSDTYSEVAEYSLAEDGAFAHPVFAAGRVLIKDHQHLACFELPQ